MDIGKASEWGAAIVFCCCVGAFVGLFWLIVALIPESTSPMGVASLAVVLFALLSCLLFSSAARSEDRRRCSTFGEFDYANNGGTVYLLCSGYSDTVVRCFFELAHMRLWIVRHLSFWLRYTYLGAAHFEVWR